MRVRFDEIYIFAGLEYSGTTVRDYLLSQSQGAAGLGQVHQFLSSNHMVNYMRQWVDQDDVEISST